jgi:hypothetical protein
MNVRGRKAAKHAHARLRAHERLGLDLSRKACESIVKQIQNGSATLVEWLSETRSSWIVEYQGTEMRVIYDTANKQLITIMPVFYKDMWGEFVE